MADSEEEEFESAESDSEQTTIKHSKGSIPTQDTADTFFETQPHVTQSEAQSQPQEIETQFEAQETQPEAQKTQPKAQETQSKAQETQSEAQETQSKAQETQSEAQETQSGAQETQSEAQETQSEAQETQSKAQETQPKAQETQSKAQETQPKAQETQSEAQETQPKAQETQSKAQETQPKAQETQSEAQPKAQETQSKAQETQPKAQETQSSGWGWGYISSAWNSSVSAVTGTTQQEAADSPTNSAGGFGELFSGIASAVQSTSMNIVSGGLDALEVIGRKTVDIISEGDPGLRKKRAMLSNDTKTLSQLLREAREEFTDELHESNKTETETNYSLLFEQYGGIVHLEALELLSEECSNKLNGVNCKELCTYFDVKEEEEDGKLDEIKTLLNYFDERLKIDQLLQTCYDAHEKGKQVESIDDILVMSINSLAQVCSMSIQLLRKTAELTLLPQMNVNINELASNLQRVVSILASEFETIASLFAEKMTEKSSDDNTVVTNIYLEASNSSSYLQNAFKLLLPILQYKLIQSDL